MLPDRVSNPGPLTYESGALPIALRGPARRFEEGYRSHTMLADFSGHKCFIKFRIPIDFSAFFSVQEN